jgi:hypothetical protein
MDMPDTSERLVINQDVLSRRLSDATILLNLQTDHFFELNRTGSRLWELLQAGCNRTQIREQLLREFDVNADALEKELHEIVTALLAHRLVSYDE